MRNFLFRNFYAERDGGPAVDFETFRREGSLPRRLLSGFRETADVIHQESRYRKAAGQEMFGHALWLAAAVMKAERVLPGVARRVLRRTEVKGRRTIRP